ncbi:hypothetical protein PV08_09012 [Exophiala spinifera]|uniref:Uncharacterized protein n=1 Tax=Exophiala spinifera TaxID=91928 RepID=A0A0D2AZ40_9EURO|nr:uncharacterized protein PV08_09012 [Exophiala spinifera]KIW11740.1 hypothetical protein PV08_09012 [Exophiala spinifera]
MGRQKATTDELWARAEANGYKRGAHDETDKVRDAEKYVSKTEKDQDRTLHRWCHKILREDYDRQGLAPPDEATVRACCLAEGVPAPDLVTVKDFLRFYIATSHPQLERSAAKPRPTADVICTVAEWFFAGFARTAGSDTKAEDRSEVYYWIRRSLVLEGIVVNKHRPKHNFTVRDLTRVFVALWTYDDLIFIHERYRVQTTFLIHLYCWTGARIDAFFKGGLRYKDVDLILQRVDGTEDGRDWRLVYKVDQRYVKNNRDPENVTFGAAAKDHRRLFYNDAGLLLQLAIADGALFGYDTLADVRQQVIPAGKDEVILRFKDEALDQPILRKCTRTGGVTTEPMPKTAFLAIFKSTLVNAGYFWSLSIHAIRRMLGKGADRRNTAVERSQHLTQADLRVFGQSYLANCSSVDGQAAFRNEESDERHIEYFQSIEKFHEDGLPTELPAHLEEELKHDGHLCSLEAEVQRLRGSDGDNQAFSTAQRQLTAYSRKLKRDALRLYQETWVQQRRDWKILTRGKETAQDNSKTELAQSIYKLFPERGRLADKMTTTRLLTSDEMWAALDDLHTLCLRSSDVFYLPGSRPSNDACPVENCQCRMHGLPKSQRNQHIQNCVRREMASSLGRLTKDIHYCYWCFDWVVGGKWEPHCRAHLDALTTKRCGSVIHYHTMVFAGYCPFCIGDASLPPHERLKPWSRDHKLWIHVQVEHLDGSQWPLKCLHPLCDNTLHKDPGTFQFHLMDVHNFSRSRPAALTKSRPQSTPADEAGFNNNEQNLGPVCRKRSSKDDYGGLAWQPPASAESMNEALQNHLRRLPKRRRHSSSTTTVCPQVVMLDDDSSCSSNSDSETTSDQSDSSALALLEAGDFYTDLGRGPSPYHYPSKCEQNHSSEAEKVDDDYIEDTLFDQYLRSPSPSPTLPSGDSVSEWSGATLTGNARDSSCESIPPAGLERLSAVSATSLDTAPCATEVGLPAGRTTRIRLRVGPPKITLRVKIPEDHRRTKVAERKRKRREGKKVVSNPKQQNGRGRKKSLR